MDQEHRGLLFGILAAFAYSLLAISVRYCSSLPTAQILFLRFSIGFLVLMPWMLHSQVKISFSKIPKNLIRSLAGIGSLACFFYTVENMPLVNAMTFSNSSPLFIPLIYFLWKKLIIPKKRMVALLIGFLGVLVILRPSEQFFNPVNLVGVTNGLLAAIAFVSIRELGKTEKTHTILFYYFLISICVTAIPAVVYWKEVETTELWMALLFMALSGSVYQYFLTKSYEYAPATKASIMTYLGVVFGGLLAWLFFKEVPSFWEICGALLVISGGVIALFDKSKAREWRG